MFHSTCSKHVFLINTNYASHEHNSTKTTQNDQQLYTVQSFVMGVHKGTP